MADEDPLDEKVRSQMPASLAAVAATNLAAQDAATAKFNAVAATLPTPGVGATYSSPVTDLANLNVADAMSRADQFNGAQPSGGFQPRTPTIDVLRAGRDYPDMVNNAIENRRAVLADAIANNTDPDNPALYVNDRPGLHGSPSRKQEILSEFNIVNNAAHQAAVQRANDTNDTFTRDQHIKSADQFTNLVHGIAAIEAPIGTPEHEKAVLGLVADNPLGSQTLAGRELLMKHAATNDVAAQMTPPAGTELTRVVQTSDGKSHAIFEPISPTTTYTSKADLIAANPNAKPKQNAKGGWYDSGETTKAIDSTEADLQKGFGVTKSQFLNPVKVEAGTTDSNGTFTNDPNGQIYRIDTGKSKNPTILMPKKLFDAYKAAFSPAAPAAPVATPPVATADERVSVISPDGKAGTLPKSQLAEALKAGYKAK